MRRSLVLLTSLAALCASAQSFDLYGVSPRAVGMAGAQGASDGDFAAAFTNPAMLRGGGAGAAFLWTKPFLSIIQTAETGRGQEFVAQSPPISAGWTAGFAVPLRGLLKDKATLGVCVFLPTRHVFASRMIDEGTSYFLRYDTAPERIQLALGASARPWTWLWLGAGVQVMSDYGGDAAFTAVLGTQTVGHVTRRALTNDITGVAAPTAGVAVGPFAGVKAFAAWHAQVLAVYALPIAVNLGDFGALDVSVKGISHFAPHTVSAGASASLLEDRLFVTADVTWEHWSAVPPLVADMSIVLEGTLLDLGFNKDVVSRPLEMGFSDVVSPRVAAEWHQTDRLTFRAGYALRSTPVPAQTGRTNFLDSTAHLVSAGAGYTLDDPLKMANGLTLEAAVQGAILPMANVVKGGPNRSPDYRFGGSVLTLTAGARYRF